MFHTPAIPLHFPGGHLRYQARREACEPWSPTVFFKSRTLPWVPLERSAIKHHQKRFTVVNPLLQGLRVDISHASVVTFKVPAADRTTDNISIATGVQDTFISFHHSRDPRLMFFFSAVAHDGLRARNAFSASCLSRCDRISLVTASYMKIRDHSSLHHGIASTMIQPTLGAGSAT
jgi:hypothetical protein